MHKIKIKVSGITKYGIIIWIESLKGPFSNAAKVFYAIEYKDGVKSREITQFFLKEYHGDTEIQAKERLIEDVLKAIQKLEIGNSEDHRKVKVEWNYA